MVLAINRSFHYISSFWQRVLLNCRQVILLHAFVALCIAVSGCRERRWQLVPIQGTITQVGQPLAGLQVVFWPDVSANTQGPRTVGQTDTAGRYELHTDAGDRGAAVGKYRVCLLRSDGIHPFRGKKIATGKDNKTESLNAEEDLGDYSLFEKTPLRAEVRPGGMQTLDFDIP